MASPSFPDFCLFVPQEMGIQEQDALIRKGTAIAYTDRRLCPLQQPQLLNLFLAVALLLMKNLPLPLSD